MPPAWSKKNLTRHRNKHGACFEDLLGIGGRVITEREYADRAQRAIDKSWMEYQAEKAHTYDDEFDPPRLTHVDDELVIAITDLPRAQMITSFHEHFDRPHGVEPGPRATVGDRKLRYRQQVLWDDQGRMIRNLRVAKDV